MDSGLRWLRVGATIAALILIPFALFGDLIDGWSTGLLSSGPSDAAVAAIVVALLAADVLLPVPSSVISTLGGAFLGFAGGIVVSAVGMSVGCAVGHSLGRSLGREWTRRTVGDSEMARLERLTASFGSWMLVVCRPVPVLAEASTLLAWVSAMSFGRFVALTTLANLGISAVYAAVGAYAAAVESFLLVFAGALLVPGAATLAYRGLSRAKRTTPSPARADRSNTVK